MKRLWSALILISMMSLYTSAAAQEPSVRGGFSGYWFNREHNQQGMQIEVTDPRQAMVTWITYDMSGQPVWLAGIGSIRGNTIEVPLLSFRGGRFPTSSDGVEAHVAPWGTAEIEFADCNSAQLSWDTESAGFQGGSLALTRLNGVEGTRCGAAEHFQRTVGFSFEQGAGPWSAVFADYTEATEDSIDFESGWTELPQPLTDRNGFLLAGTNAPDDLAMFLKAPLAGLQPETKYRVELDMTFATSEPQNCAGIGGSPGSSVGVKLGAAGTEPTVVEPEDGSFRFNIDTGGGPQRSGPSGSGGEDALRVGDMTNFQEECVPMEEEIWQLKTVSTRGEAFTATTDSNGRLWIYGGSDSGFEGRTTFFVTDFTVRLVPAIQKTPETTGAN